MCLTVFMAQYSNKTQINSVNNVIACFAKCDFSMAKCYKNICTLLEYTLVIQMSKCSVRLVMSILKPLWKLHPLLKCLAFRYSCSQEDAESAQLHLLVWDHY